MGVEGAERMGWGPKRYVGFCYKIHIPNAIFADVFVYGPDSVANRATEPKTILPRKKKVCKRY